MTIAPREKHVLRFKILLTGRDAGKFEAQFTLYVNCGNIVTLTGSVAGNVTPRETS